MFWKISKLNFFENKVLLFSSLYWIVYYFAQKCCIWCKFSLLDCRLLSLFYVMAIMITCLAFKRTVLYFFILYFNFFFENERIAFFRSFFAYVFFSLSLFYLKIIERNSSQLIKKYFPYNIVLFSTDGIKNIWKYVAKYSDSDYPILTRPAIANCVFW